MTPAIIVALTPLWLGLVGAAFVLTFGRRIAHREREARLQFEREQEQQAMIESVQVAQYPYMSTACVPNYFPVGSTVVRMYYVAGHAYGLAGAQALVVNSNQIRTESTKAEQQTDVETKPALALVA